MTCPKCRSSEVVHKDKEFHEISHRAGHHAARGAVQAMHGHPVMLAVVGGAWLLGKAAHALSHAYTCNSCNHRFS